MAQTYTENGGGAPNGTTTTFTYSFETIEETNETNKTNSEVKVALNGATQNSNRYDVIKSTSSIQFHNTNGVDSTMQAASGAPLTGVKVRVYRDTKVTSPGDKRHTFQAGSAIKARALNDIYEHTLFALDEEREQNIFSEDIEDGAVIRSKIGADAVDGTKIADDSLDSEHYVDGSIDLAHLSANSVDSSKIVDGSIVNADVNASAGIEISKLGGLNSSKIIVGNSSNIPSPVDMSGDVTIDNAGATTIAADAVQFANISDTQVTSAFNAASDDKIPTSKAVADHVVNVVNSVGGFVIVADKDNFPASHPDPNNDAGTVLSITNPNGLTVSSNTSSNGTRTGGSSTVTINNIPTDAGSTLTANYTMLVQTTSTEHTYDFYKFLAKDGDVLSLSNDINDFAARYRVAATAPVTGLCDANGENTGSYPCDGDMYFNSSDNKMYVFGAPASSTSTSDLQAAWAQVTSTGEFKSLTVKTNGQPHNGTLTFDGTATQFDLFDGNSAASIVNRNQLIVVLNGVVQKSNAGVYSSSEEGFYLDGTDGIKFCTAPPADSTIFVTLIGSAVSVPTPGDETVTEAKLNTNAPTNDYVLTADSTATGGFKWAAAAATVGGDNGVRFNDNVSVAFGTGTDNDMLIKHTPEVTVLEANDGGIAINADEIQLISNDTAGRAVFLDGPNDRLELGYDGNHSVLINSTGVTFVKNQSHEDGVETVWGADSDLTIKEDSNQAWITAKASGKIHFGHGSSNNQVSVGDHGIGNAVLFSNGNTEIGNQGWLMLNSPQCVLKFQDSANLKTVGFKAASTIAADVTWELPAADATSSGQALTSDAAGTLSWSDVSSTVANDAIYINDDEITDDYTVAAGKGAHSVGPITLTGCTVTVNGRWVIS